MKIVYIANSSIPSKSANSIHVMKMCEAFKENGIDVELIVPNIGEYNLLTTNINEFDFYGILSKFDINYEKSVSYEPVGFYQYLFSFLSVIKALFKKPDIIMTRNPIIALISIVFYQKVIIEMHSNIEAVSNFTYKIYKKFNIFNHKRLIKLIVISDKLKDIYLNKYKIDYNKIQVLHDGVNLNNFVKYDKIPILEENFLNICYVGSMNKGRGIDIIFNMAKKDKNNIYNIYGGEIEDIKYWNDLRNKEEILNININGHINNSEVPKILSQHDVVLMPYQKEVFVRGSEDTSSWMSPMKMFEYMASGRVIISSNLSVIQEVLNDDNSYLVSPDNIDEWVNAINYIKDNKEKAILKTKKALEDVQSYTWQNRAKRIMEMINE